MKETINALELEDSVIEALAFARTFGLLIGHPEVDSLADGGAQLILSFGRKRVEKVFPDGVNYELSPEEVEFMESVVAQVLGKIDFYREEFKKIVG